MSVLGPYQGQGGKKENFRWVLRIKLDNGGFVELHRYCDFYPSTGTEYKLGKVAPVRFKADNFDLVYEQSVYLGETNPVSLEAAKELVDHLTKPYKQRRQDLQVWHLISEDKFVEDFWSEVAGATQDAS